MIKKFIEWVIPAHDKLKHFYLWSIFLVVNLYILDDFNAYLLSIASAVSWELYQKFIKKGTNSIKEMFLDVFFGGFLPALLHYLTTL
mgnify:FL=1